jgi:hypothetical protein
MSLLGRRASRSVDVADIGTLEGAVKHVKLGRFGHARPPIARGSHIGRMVRRAKLDVERHLGAATRTWHERYQASLEALL